MGTVSTIRIILQVVAILVLIVSLAFLIAAFMTTAWQAYWDPGNGEIHQHGLWLDFTFGVPHAATMDERPRWISKIKFGRPVDGDENHRAKDYQLNTLILMVLSTLLAIGGGICACGAAVYPVMAALWAITIFLAMFLSATALIVFYIGSLTYRFINTDKQIEQYISYSFWYAFAGTIGLFLSLLFAISFNAFIIMIRKRDERPTYQAETRPKVLVTKHHITSL